MEHRTGVKGKFCPHFSGKDRQTVSLMDIARAMPLPPAQEGEIKGDAESWADKVWGRSRGDPR